MMDTSALRIAIIVSRYNEHVTSALLAGAKKTLIESGIAESKIEVHYVPGAFELPLAAQAASMRSNVDAVICLGAVIRGETPHFDYVCSSAAQGILQASLKSGKPIGFGVLTTNTVEQAFARAGGTVGNKGSEAALAVIEMIRTLHSIGGEESR